MTPASVQRLTRLAIIAVTLLLAACRMPVKVSGQGYVFGEDAGQLYRAGYTFEINEDFQETFWPVPAPGYSFGRWTDICNNLYGPCELTLDEPLWSRDDSIPLGARFRRNYSGPLEIRYYETYWYEATRTLSVPLSRVDLRGANGAGSPRYFMASPDLEVIVPAARVGPDLLFPLPNDEYPPEDYWLFASATDSEGIIASASISFGLASKVPAGGFTAYDGASPWASALPACVAANTPFQLCSLATLPFIGQQAASPSVEEVLARTVVSHPWMGRRFEQVLRALPQDMLPLFRGATAVVIGADIRPAFYTSATGAIYLDPQDLWLTPEERQTIDWAPDYRTEYGHDLNFISYDLYISGSEAAWTPAYLYEEFESRTLQDILLPVATLLVHELAHANDAVAPALLGLVSDDETVLEAVLRLENRSPSLQLLNTYPLTSSFLYQLAEILYFGAPVAEPVLELSARGLGLEFVQDEANALYAFATPYEDTAMLVEEVLTHYFFGADRLVSFLDAPVSGSGDCSDYTVQWSSINRVAKPAVKERARLVLSGILDVADVSRYLAAIPEPRKLQRGLSLCENLDRLASAPGALPGKFIPPPELARRQVEKIRSHRQMRQRSGRGRAGRGRIVPR
ncbi:hypothetical protein E2F43_05750 [Seongchinamella unica]|uniref:Bacterial repeat domain-containing protein n=1 Tax=Seongchinamella unica TaxID=2547392 RepID=A0A4R5LWT0_9GAMM|nr:hypothetical protein [Seongchinamella unica]TDG15728.1 hypothetical protein E2F43_05750 [Seongchinamella unica]